MLRGPVKVDLIFPDEPHSLEPPWRVSADTLQGIDAHFWDWILWLDSKEAAGKKTVVATELDKLFEHLLEPLGTGRRLSSIPEAVAAYRDGRERAEHALGTTVSRGLENEVAPALSRRISP